MTEALSVEATGETVGEAKWVALRELERIAPGLDKAAVRFQVVSEGERGLLGVGFEPARVVATVDPDAVVEAAAVDESERAAKARALVDRVTASLGLRCRIDVAEDEETITVSCAGGDLGLLIGRHGQTIDAVQYLANAIVNKGIDEGRKRVVVDAAGYRARREETLHREAVSAAERATSTGEPVELEPMTSIERRVVHERLKEYPGVETLSEGAEPNRYVVVSPSS
ncbi:MAG: RNA-binding cell elongation regulator Jag/EloR [Gaiellaceae bacterium]